MRFVVLGLVPHPQTPCRAVERIEVRVERLPAGRLALVYALHGRLDSLRIPPPRPPAFADGLWHHTCCEAFVAGAGGDYDEFNFSPSGQFAAYRFSGYRAGMSRLAVPVPVSWKGLLLETEVPLREDAAVMGLSAVIEESDGTISFWALRHPAGKPDFHHAETFALRLDEVRY